MALWGNTDDLAGAPKWLTPSFTFDGTGADKVVSATADTITINNHGIQSGTKVFITSASNDLLGTDVSGIQYAEVVDPDTIKLNGTYNGTAFGTLRELTEAGTGHTLQVIPTAVDVGEAVGAAPAVSVFFVDAAEAKTDANRDKGFQTPGWYKYVTYDDSDGVTRHKAELLCAFGESVYDVAVGDTGVTGLASDEDGVVAGEQALITIGTQPIQDGTDGTNSATVDLAGNASIVLVTAATVAPVGGTINYQWQEKSATAGSEFTNLTTAGVYSISAVDGATSALTISGTTDNLAGYQYRCVVSHAEADSVTSTTVTATQQ
jgi:hypothetical protein